MRRIIATIFLIGFALPASAAEPVDYSRDVLPILSANCFVCHGRDESTREMELRIDLRDEAIRKHDKITPIVPGHPESSAIIARITDKNEDDRMPPVAIKKRLS